MVTQESQRAVEEAFGIIWPTHVHNLTKFLVRCREEFGGDLELFLVLAVIGECTYSQQHADPTRDYSAFRAGQLGPTTPIKVNISSIAGYSGISRETVRRKVKLLIEKGWVVRESDDCIFATRKSASDLEDLTRVSIRYIAGMRDLFKSLDTVRPEKNGSNVESRTSD